MPGEKQDILYPTVRFYVQSLPDGDFYVMWEILDVPLMPRRPERYRVGDEELTYFARTELTTALGTILHRYGLAQTVPVRDVRDRP